MKAAGLEAEELAAFLNARCSDDPEVRAEVESLLASDAIQTDAARDAIFTTVETAAMNDAVGCAIGPYRVKRRVGEGVQHAHQKDVIHRKLKP